MRIRADGVLPADTVLREFNARSGEVESGLRRFIAERLREYAAQGI